MLNQQNSYLCTNPVSKELTLFKSVLISRNTVMHGDLRSIEGEPTLKMKYRLISVLEWYIPRLGEKLNSLKTRVSKYFQTFQSLSTEETGHKTMSLSSQTKANMFATMAKFWICSKWSGWEGREQIENITLVDDMIPAGSSSKSWHHPRWKIPQMQNLETHLFCHGAITQGLVNLVQYWYNYGNETKDTYHIFYHEIT